MTDKRPLRRSPPISLDVVPFVPEQGAIIRNGIIRAIDGRDSRHDSELAALRVLIISHTVDELKVVAAPRNVRERIVNDGRHHANVFLENGSRVNGERSAGLEARKRLDGVKIDGQKPIELKVEVGKRKVHNLWLFSTKSWTV